MTAQTPPLSERSQSQERFLHRVNSVLRTHSAFWFWGQPNFTLKSLRLSVENTYPQAPSQPIESEFPNSYL